MLLWGFLLLGGGLLPTGCTQTLPGELGDRCGKDTPCKGGLRCSFEKKRCYRPVDCNRLQKRLDACAPELLAVSYPRFKKLPATRRVELVTQVTEHLRTKVVAPCRYDVWAAKRKKGKTPAVKRSWGEDPRAAQMNACLAKTACKAFARCVLEQARVLGPKAPKAHRMRVLPLDPSHPRPSGATPGRATAPRPTTPGRATAPRPAAPGRATVPRPAADPNSLHASPAPRERPTTKPAQK